MVSPLSLPALLLSSPSPPSIPLSPSPQLQEYAAGSHVEELRHRAELAEDSYHKLELRNEQLVQELERYKDAHESLNDRYAELERALREETRYREDAADTAAKLKQQLDRTNDELQK